MNLLFTISADGNGLMKRIKLLEYILFHNFI